MFGEHGQEFFQRVKDIPDEGFYSLPKKMGRTGRFINDGLRLISLGSKQKQKNTNTVQKPNTVLVAFCHFPPSPYRIPVGSSANKSLHWGYRYRSYSKRVVDIPNVGFYSLPKIMGRTGRFIYDGLRLISLGCKQKQKNTNNVQKPNTVLVAVCHSPSPPYRLPVGSSANNYVSLPSQ